MSRTPNYDKKVRAILAATKPSERTCAVTGEKWMMTDEEIGWYKRFNKPPSKLAPMTRMRLLTSFFSGYQWWNHKHMETGKPLLSSVHPASGVKVLPDKEWFERDFQSVNLDVDAGRPFFDQLRQLQTTVPFSSSRNYVEPENSICMASLGDQNSYFVLACKSKNSFFSTTAHDMENSAECYQSSQIRDSFNVVFSTRIFNCRFIHSSADCIRSSFLFDCRNCENCFGATGKRNRKYLWWNEQFSHEEWEKRFREIDFGSRRVVRALEEQYDQMIRRSVWPENFNVKDENCIGEYLVGAVNCDHVYMAPAGARDNYWCGFALGNAQNNAFCCGPVSSQQCYYTGATGYAHGCYATSFCSRVQNCEYCIQCYDCENCFGCVGLRKKKFCILNKPFTEAEYWRKVDEIKCRMLDAGEYGEYLPASFSPSYFPESGAIMFYDADPQIGHTFGGNMFDPSSFGAYGDENTDSSKVRQVTDVPDSIDDLTDDWVGVPIHDDVINRRFVMIKPEVEFYKKMRIAPPDKHFTRRVRDLYWAANIGVFEDHVCASCNKHITVARNRKYPERKIYCKECYFKFLETI